MLSAIKRCYLWLRLSWLIWRIRRSKNDTTQQAAKQALAAQLADGRGLPMKIGQVLAGMGDDDVYQSLTQSVQPWKLRDMLPILEQAWQQPWSEVLLSIEESQAAASLGQVHQARDKHGHQLAIKVQYPDIKQAMAAEMAMAGMLPKGGPVKKWDFDLQAYKTTLQDNISHELDYIHEKNQQIAFKKGICVEGLAVPTVVEALCRHHVLVQSWAEGCRLSAAQHWTPLQRWHIAKILMQTMFQSIFKLGLVHGDPHPGNLLCQKQGEQATVTLLDFGCMIHLQAPRRLALLQLIMGSRGESQVDALDGFVALGFDAAKLRLIQDKLPSLMHIIFRPFMQDEAFDVQQWHPGQEAEALLGEQRWIFRAAGPADLFLLMRVFQGLVQQLMLLQVSLPWWETLLQAVPDAVLQQAKHAVATQHESKAVKIAEEKQQSVKGTAKTLHIRISESGQQKAHIQLPAANALALSDLMPSEASAVLQKANISLADIEKRLLEHGLEPQQLIDIPSQEKRYELWLE